jgi:hypothetical protein
MVILSFSSTTASNPELIATQMQLGQKFKSAAMFWTDQLEVAAIKG